MGKLIVEFTCECGTRCRVTFRPPANNLSVVPRVPLLQHCAKGKPQFYANILNFEGLYEAEWMEVSPLHEGDKRQQPYNNGSADSVFIRFATTRSIGRVFRTDGYKLRPNGAWLLGDYIERTIGAYQETRLKRAAQS